VACWTSGIDCFVGQVRSVTASVDYRW